MMKAMIAGAAALAMLTGAVMNTETENKEMLGEWTESDEPEMTEELKEIFEIATEDLIGVKYEVIELLETQIVSGTNYKFLAEKQVVYPGSEKETVIVTVYKDLMGRVSILDIESE